MPARELNVLIRDANYLLVFLPIANFAYVYLNNSAIMIMGLVIISSFVSAFSLNFTLGIPDPKDSPTTHGLSGGATILYFGSLIAWVALLAYSIYRLKNYIGQSNSYANILFIISIGWIILLGTHYLLDWWIDDYSNPIFEFTD